ncbi:hypothetical protein EVAR_86425_1 [Eumeta japonica]|uniref:Uncharacterized protein n=1 Tax=Eumeta variegata TaxID=151549 RepID=A0A4C1ZBW1_EUMVA|nr:hypothetical protein EVAR_86425_1 [Eumeta japonica]
MEEMLHGSSMSSQSQAWKSTIKVVTTLVTVFNLHLRGDPNIQVAYKAQYKDRGRLLSRQESYNGLRLAFHEESPSIATVYNWLNELERSRINLTDALREGRRSTATTEDNISAVQLKIEPDEVPADLAKLRYRYWSSA